MPIVHDLGAHKSNWQIVAASSAESLWSGFFFSMLLTKDSIIGGTFEVMEGKSLEWYVRLSNPFLFMLWL